MKKLNRFRHIGFVIIGIAIVLELLGALANITALTITAFVILICLLIAHLILYRCPYCSAYLGRRYGDAIIEEDGKHICPFCGEDLDKE